MDKQLTQMSLAEFCEVLGSSAPAPGGGSAAALIGSLGISLGMMTANLTASKKKWEDKHPLMHQVIAAATPIQAGMVCSIDKDTAAFNEVMSAMALPKETDEQKQLRRNAIAEATKGATKVPFELMQRCEAAMDVLEKLNGNINPACASDLGVAAIGIRTAVQGAWLNVLINLGGIKDEKLVELYRSEGERMVNSVVIRADRLYSDVLLSL